MALGFQLVVLTQEGVVLERNVASVIVPGADGYLGLLAHHAPLAAVLGNGQMRIRELDDTTSVYQITGGFLEFADNRATVLADNIGEGSE
jgi:F-type H+-transporting ATPase subunit epsilon